MEGAGPIPGADLLVNCTAVGLADPFRTFKDLPIAADAIQDFRCVVDLVYRPGGTELTRMAGRAGCDVVDGLEVIAEESRMRHAQAFPERDAAYTLDLDAGGRYADLYATWIAHTLV